MEAILEYLHSFFALFDDVPTATRDKTAFNFITVQEEGSIISTSCKGTDTFVDTAASTQSSFISTMRQENTHPYLRLKINNQLCRIRARTRRGLNQKWREGNLRRSISRNVNVGLARTCWTLVMFLPNALLQTQSPLLYPHSVASVPQMITQLTSLLRQMDLARLSHSTWGFRVFPSARVGPL